MTGFTEDELIAALQTLIGGEAPGLALGIGDDGALVEVGDRLAVLTVDMLIEGVHFQRSWTSPHDLGYKALAVNVSDVAAMAGSPRHALVALGLSPDVEMAWVVELYAGLRDAAAEYAVAIAGGDTSRSERVVISVTVMGEVLAGRAVTRSGARAGDRVVVTGSLGAAAGGLVLSRAAPGTVGSAVVSEWGRELLEAHARPIARVGEGQTLAQFGATAMIDVSDGLAKDLGRLCSAGGVGAAVELAAVPVSAALRRLAREGKEVDPLALALHGGEDYELLATLAPDAAARATEALRERFGTPLTDIGQIREEEGLVVVDADGRERPLEPEGWDHFAA